MVRALAMFGLFYFPNRIAFLQHSSVAQPVTLVFLCRKVKINCDYKATGGERVGRVLKLAPLIEYAWI